MSKIKGFDLFFVDSLTPFITHASEAQTLEFFFDCEESLR